jgi:hypothetical protein
MIGELGNPHFLYKAVRLSHSYIPFLNRFRLFALVQMAPSIPKTIKAWTIEGHDGFKSLKLNQQAELNQPTDYEVLVKFHAASLNYRDLIIPKGKAFQTSSNLELWGKSTDTIQGNTHSHNAMV